jgi:hypothetical protein
MLTYIIAAFALVVLLIAAVFLVRLYGFRLLYPLILISFTQNLVVPALYTAGIINVLIAQLLIYSKEILLLVLFLYALRRLSQERVRYPLSIKIMVAFVGWVLLRGLFGLAFGDSLHDGTLLMRNLVSPLEFLVVGMAAAREFGLAEKFEKFLVRTIVILGLIAVVMLFALPKDFFATYVNIATYNVEVKGYQSGLGEDEETGISGTSNTREAFAELAPFRAFGTFGEPLSMSFNMAFGLIFVLYMGLESTAWRRWVALACLSLALLLGVSRSAWIFAACAVFVVQLARRKYTALIVIGLLVVCAFTFIAPLRGFVQESIEQGTDVADAHAQGLTRFYVDIWKDGGNILGKGADDAKQTIPESGYATLTEHYGFPTYALFLLFCMVLAAEALRFPEERRTRGYIVLGIVLGTFITQHTSYYAFTFNCYIAIWLFVGLSLPATSEADEMALDRLRVQQLSAAANLEFIRK